MKNYPTENFFNFDLPDDYLCCLTFFTAKHPHMIVNIQDTIVEREWRVSFLLEYFEGPIYWQGANFCIAGQDEYQELLEKLGYDINIYRDKLLLLTVKTASNFRVRILTRPPKIEVVPPFVRPEI